MRRLAIAMLLLAWIPGCMFAPGPVRRTSILNRRPAEPWRETVYRRGEASDESRSMSELRATLEYWNAMPASLGGARRADGVLVCEPATLYDDVLRRIEEGASELRLRAYRYDAVGFDELTVVDWLDEDGTVIGTDWPADDPPPTKAEGDAPAFIGYDDLSWWEYPMFLLDVPVYTLIGAKELVGEIVKAPISLLDAGILGPAVAGRNPLSPVALQRGGGALCGDIANGFTAFAWRFRVRRRHDPVELALDLLGAVPIVGPIFEPKAPHGPSIAPPDVADEILVSRGIHGGGDEAQILPPLLGLVREARPETTVRGLPYHDGGLFDTIWSLLNLSSGMSYDAAARVVFRPEGPPDRATLVGFSGGVQRMVVASRLLARAGVSVDRVIGIAGPYQGHAAAWRAWALLGDDPWTDPVILATHVVNFLLFFLPSNLAKETIENGGEHWTPGFPHGATRAPALGYGAALAERLGGRR